MRALMISLGCLLLLAGLSYPALSAWVAPNPAPRLLASMKADPRFARLDLVVEYPFKDGRQVAILAGCADSSQDATDARRWLYQRGMLAVFDSTSRTPKDGNAEYIKASCSALWMHDGRRVFEFVALPKKPHGSLDHLPVTDAQHRERISTSLDEQEALQALGLWQLSTTLQELYRDIMLWKRGVYDPESLLRHLQVKLEIWARMAPQDVTGESLTPAEWKARQEAGYREWQKSIKK